LKPGRELHANVEFYAGVVMKVAGLEPAMFTPTFCVARMVGWTANILEQAQDTKIIRPTARYTGPSLGRHVERERAQRPTAWVSYAAGRGLTRRRATPRARRACHGSA
ncbi:citrate/2-methylcitrate synthase, partial [Intrasporangium sp.]|uniref:citrate/2-methylcitrate synthase n=1 Tax=Intrasporangium sp. TaxID=1925024 RepID=UPI0033654EBA